MILVFYTRQDLSNYIIECLCKNLLLSQKIKMLWVNAYIRLSRPKYWIRFFPLTQTQQKITFHILSQKSHKSFMDSITLHKFLYRINIGQYQIIEKKKHNHNVLGNTTTPNTKIYQLQEVARGCPLSWQYVLAYPCRKGEVPESLVPEPTKTK